MLLIGIRKGGLVEEGSVERESLGLLLDFFDCAASVLSVVHRGGDRKVSSIDGAASTLGLAETVRHRRRVHLRSRQVRG